MSSKEKKQKHIAFIYEGEKTEKALIEKLQEVYFSDIAQTTVISFPAEGNIYMLWKRLKESEFETEVIEEIKEMSKIAKEKIGDLTDRDFSEIYLFFDYDAHNDNVPKAYKKHDVMKQLLETFDNETEYGKLYVSYPMIESLRELSSNTEDYSTFYVEMSNEINYKNYVSEQIEFQNFKKIKKEKWEIACRASLKRANLIVNYKEKFPTYEQFLRELGQNDIFKAQLEKFVFSNKMVAVLNSVPLFLLEYFDKEFWNQVVM